tara:strand:+ start:680 stop:961 length:282 start_codon:yes stop_codon:yes gene_type:complete
MDLIQLSKAINDFGFPIIAACGGGYMIYFIWVWATTIVQPMLSEASTVLIALIDRVRLLDNDMIRLTQKVNIVLMLRELSDEKNNSSDTTDRE